MRTRAKIVGGLVGGFVLLGALASPSSGDTAQVTRLPAGTLGPTAFSQAQALLSTLDVSPKATSPRYVRTAFGPTWFDEDGNKCSTRDDVLSRDLTHVTYKDASKCTVASGTLADPYTGKTIQFTRGVNTSLAVQIDHVVALGDAWASGASTWTDAKRQEFANDPAELLAVDGPSNEKKGDSTADEWMPPNPAEACDYVARQVKIKATYHLTVTDPEAARMEKVLATCPGTIPTPTPKPVLYANCAAVRAAGAAPLHVGQPGYSRNLDRDGDGTACDT